MYVYIECLPQVTPFPSTWEVHGETFEIGLSGLEFAGILRTSNSRYQLFMVPFSLQ